MSDTFLGHPVAKNCTFVHGTVISNEVCPCGCGCFKLGCFDENGVIRAIISHTPEQWREIVQMMDGGEAAFQTKQ